MNAQISALSNLFGFLREAATSDLKLPLWVPSPAHAQFIGRTKPESRTPTRALARTLADQLMALLNENTVPDARDRAIFAVFRYLGVRIGTACKLEIRCSHTYLEDSTLSMKEKERSRSMRTVGVHLHCVEATREYLSLSELKGEPLFLVRLNFRSRNSDRTPTVSRPCTRCSWGDSQHCRAHTTRKESAATAPTRSALRPRHCSSKQECRPSVSMRCSDTPTFASPSLHQAPQRYEANHLSRRASVTTQR